MQILGGSDCKASACNVGDLGSIPGSEDPLEKEMATHSSILAWRIPWTEEPGGLQSMGRKESDTPERLHFHFHLFKRAFPVAQMVKNLNAVPVTWV